MTEKRTMQPEGRRQDDHQLRQAVRDVMKERSWQRSIVLGCTALSVLCALVSLTVSFTTLHNRSDIVHTQDLTAQNKRLVQAVQRERARTLLDNCRDQNSRHAATARRLDLLISKIPDPALRRRAEVQKKASLALIDTLAPQQDCQAKVRASVQVASPTPTP